MRCDPVLASNRDQMDLTGFAKQPPILQVHPQRHGNVEITDRP